jgi:phenylacetate 2-hydroxylase
MLAINFMTGFTVPNGFAVLGLATGVIGIAIVVFLRFFYVDFAKIDGIPEIPNGDLLAGHLYQLGDDHATKSETWARAYGWPVFQLRMGRRRAIVLNSFDAAREWIVKNQTATLDRPWFHTFHGVISATSGIRKTRNNMNYMEG